jgi:hypothetical protein
MSEYADTIAECQSANRIAARLRGVTYAAPPPVRAKACRTPAPRQPYPLREVTPAQLRVLDYMRAFLAENDELPPLWAIAKHFGWSSVNSAQDQVAALGRKGLLERNEIGNWRIARSES